MTSLRLPCLLCAGLLALTAAPPPGQADGIPADELALPVVPASVDPRGKRSATMRRGPLEHAGGTIVIAPGETKALIVSAGNVNRIVTPFAQPDIVTTSPDQFEVRQNVVYAAPAMGEPVTVYLTEQGDEATAISLILVPQLNVASREFRLELAGTGGRPRLAGPVRQASDWERNQPFEATLSDLVARLAAGGVPQGYDLGPGANSEAAPRCANRGPFQVDFGRGQHLTGGQLEAWVGLVTNGGGSTAEFDETLCATMSEVAAIALWPSPRLPAGGQAEIYVVRRIPPPRDRSLPRPSLIEAGHDAW
jgi:conjugal transfer pilus assembly protein TraK